MGIYYYLALRLQTAVLRRPLRDSTEPTGAPHGGIYGGQGGSMEHLLSEKHSCLGLVQDVKTIFASVHRFFMDVSLHEFVFQCVAHIAYSSKACFS